MEKTIKTSYFFGNKVSDYGIENGYVDYATLAKSFDAVLNNDIYQKAWLLGEWEQVNGYIDNSDEIEELQDKIEDLQATIEELEDEDEIEELQDKIEELEDEIQELEDEQDNQQDIYQWYIISYGGYKILEDFTNEIVFYHEELDMYLWGVTHWGTGWSHVLTDIKIDID